MRIRLVEKLSHINVALVAIAIFCGCGDSVSNVAQSPVLTREVELSRATPPVTVAVFAESLPDPPNPQPEPQPSPAGLCPRCGGAGRIRPDGRIEIECPDCDGTGRIPAEAKIDHFKTLDNSSSLRRNSPTSSGAVVQDKLARTDAPTPPIKWYPNVVQATKELKRSGKPALVFYTGDFCQPCKEFEATVLSHPLVIQALQDFVCIKSDIRILTRHEVEAWKIRAIPLCFVVKNDWSKSWRIDELTQEPEAFTKQIQELRDKAVRDEDSAVRLSQ